MKLALGISLIAAFALVLLYSILVGVMVPGWKSSTGDLLGILNRRAIVYIGDNGTTTPGNDTVGWFTTVVKDVRCSSNNSYCNDNQTLVVTIAIPSSDLYGSIEHGVVVASCACLAVLAFLVAVLWASIHCCINRPLDAKKRGDSSIPYTIFDEAK